MHPDSCKRHQRLGFGGDDTPKSEEARIHERVMASLRDTFKPEFLNRIDEIIVFSKLSDNEIKQIASLMLKSVEKRLETMNISISFDDDVIALLAEKEPIRFTALVQCEEKFNAE